MEQDYESGSNPSVMFIIGKLYEISPLQEKTLTLPINQQTYQVIYELVSKQYLSGNYLAINQLLLNLNEELENYLKRYNFITKLNKDKLDNFIITKFILVLLSRYKLNWEEQEILNTYLKDDIEYATFATLSQEQKNIIFSLLNANLLNSDELENYQHVDNRESKPIIFSELLPGQGSDRDELLNNNNMMGEDNKQHFCLGKRKREDNDPQKEDNSSQALNSEILDDKNRHSVKKRKKFGENNAQNNYGGNNPFGFYAMKESLQSIDNENSSSTSFNMNNK